MNLQGLENKSKAELQEIRDQLIIKGKISAEDSVRVLAEIQRRIDAGTW